MTTEIPQYDFEQFDSRVIIRVEATKIEQVEPQTVSFETEGALVFDEFLGTSIINIDAYFDPDYIYDKNRRVRTSNGTVYARHTSAEYTFDLFTDELLKAAKVRAAEDATHAVRVLAGWLHGTNADHVSNTDARLFLSALREAIEEAGDNCPEWAVCYGGDPDEWWHEQPPATTLEEAREFIENGYTDRYYEILEESQ